MTCPFLYQGTGEVRWVDLPAMNSQLELGNVVVVDNLGFGIAGEVSSQFHDLHTVKERGHMFFPKPVFAWVQLANCDAIDVGVSTAVALKVLSGYNTSLLARVLNFHYLN